MEKHSFHDDDSAVAWDCESPSNAQQEPVLPVATECSRDGQNHDYFNYQFQGGSPDEGSLRLPHGYGIPVGDGTAFKWIVIQFHFFEPEKLVNGSIAGSEVEVTLAPQSPRSPIRAVASLLLMAYGFVGAHSVGSVTAIWRQEEDFEMDLLLLYTHWHETNNMVIDVVVWIERTSGDEDVILRQDPLTFSGITDVTNSSTAVIRRGDRLFVECTYNNTRDHNLRVQ